jgi:hypothetical protein
MISVIIRGYCHALSFYISASFRHLDDLCYGTFRQWVNTATRIMPWMNEVKSSWEFCLSHWTRYKWPFDDLWATMFIPVSNMKGDRFVLAEQLIDVITWYTDTSPKRPFNCLCWPECFIDRRHVRPERAFRYKSGFLQNRPELIVAQVLTVRDLGLLQYFPQVWVCVMFVRNEFQYENTPTDAPYQWSDLHGLFEQHIVFFVGITHLSNTHTLWYHIFIFTTCTSMKP